MIKLKNKTEKELKNNPLNIEIFDIENELNYNTISHLNQEEMNILISSDKNKNIVIENPLNTNRISLISNIVSNAINSKKNILYISKNKEKIKDLNNKLSNVDFDNLILNIDDYNKEYFEYNIKRMNNEIKYEEFDKESMLEIKTLLNQYIEKISSYSPNMEKTNQEILLETIFYREKVKRYPKITNSEIFKDNRSVSDNLKKYEEEINNFIDKLESTKNMLSLENIKEHPWYGIQRFFFAKEKEKAENKLDFFFNELKKIKSFLNEFQDKYKILNKKDLKEAHKRISTLEKIFDFNEIEKDILININRENKNKIEKIAKRIEKNTTNINEFKKDVNVEKLKKNINKANNVINLNEEFLDKTITIQEVIEIKNVMLRIEKEIEKLSLFNRDISLKQLNLNFEEDKYLNLIELSQNITKIKNISLLKYKNINYTSEEFDIKFDNLLKEKKELDKEYKKLEQKISMKQLVDMNIEELKLHIDNFKKYNVFLYFSKMKTSKKLIKELWQETRLINNKKYILNILNQVLEHSKKRQVFKEKEEFVNFFGNIYQGVETNLESILEIKKWYENIEEKYGLYDKNSNNLTNKILNLSFKVIDFVNINYNHKSFNMLREILLNIEGDKSQTIENYELSFKKKILNYIYSYGTLNKSIENMNQISTDIKILEETIINKRLKLSELKKYINNFKIVLEIEEEIKQEDNFIKYLKKINLFEDNLNKVNFMFNKIFFIINANIDFFTGYKNRINKIIEQENLEELQNWKLELEENIEKYEEYFSITQNYFNPEKGSLFLYETHNIEECLENIENKKENIQYFLDYTKYYSIKNKLKNYKIENIIEKIENNELNKKQAIEILRYIANKKVSDNILKKSDIINDFNAEEYENKIDKYMKYSDTFINNNVAQILNKNRKKENSNNHNLEEMINNKIIKLTLTEGMNIKLIENIKFDMIIIDEELNLTENLKKIINQSAQIIYFNDEVKNQSELTKEELYIFEEKIYLNEIKNIKNFDNYKILNNLFYNNKLKLIPNVNFKNYKNENINGNFEKAILKYNSINNDNKLIVTDTNENRDNIIKTSKIDNVITLGEIKNKKIENVIYLLDINNIKNNKEIKKYAKNLSKLLSNSQNITIFHNCNNLNLLKDNNKDINNSILNNLINFNINDKNENKLKSILENNFKNLNIEIIEAEDRNLELYIQNKKTGEIILGLSLDNEKYYNSKYTKEREYITQNNYKDNGWQIYKLWTPNLYYNLDNEIEKIKKIIESKV